MTIEQDSAQHFAEQGAEVLHDIGWDEVWATGSTRGTDPEFSEFTQRVVFGQLYGRDGMSLRDRELIVMAIILTQGSERGIKPHFRRCHALGITEREVRELIYTVCMYGGWPKGSQASVWFNKILLEESSTWPDDMRVHPALPPANITDHAG
jgi:4-carboxymuconolactone decarboxylase